MTFSEWLLLFFISVIPTFTGIGAYKIDIRMMRTGYVCENDVIKLRCDKFKVLKIHGADYGRGEDSVCRKDQRSNYTCTLVDKTHSVKSRCDNKRKCTIKALSSIFGDPCPGFNKYLNIIYVCVKRRHTVTPDTTTATKTPISTGDKNATMEVTTTITKPAATSTLSITDASEDVLTTNQSNLKNISTATIANTTGKLATSQPTAAIADTDGILTIQSIWISITSMAQINQQPATRKAISITAAIRSTSIKISTTPKNLDRLTETNESFAVHSYGTSGPPTTAYTTQPRATTEPTKSKQAEPKQEEDFDSERTIPICDSSNAVILESFSGSASQPKFFSDCGFCTWACFLNLVAIWWP
ncbi:uncharacterized protein [Montipora capricornis]|uniref:uncharacterized protein n=1 Tax=Montipora capricornis TaxID=246305 RepID=UPI0035F1510E